MARADWKDKVHAAWQDIKRSALECDNPAELLEIAAAVQVMSEALVRAAKDKDAKDLETELHDILYRDF
jgi:hypothetical protein